MKSLHITFCAALISAALALCPASSSAQAPDARIATLLRESRAALGGSALERVKILHLNATATVGGLPGTNAAWQEMGGARFAESYSNPPLSGGDGYDGTSVWNRDGSGLVWVDGGQAGRAQEISAAFESNYALWAANHGGALLAWGGTKFASGRHYDVLVVRAPGSAVPFQLWFDRASHLPAQSVLTIGPRSFTAAYSAYRAVDGLMIPFATRTLSSDGNRADVTVTQAVVNPPDGPAHLRKPVSNAHDFSIAAGAAETTVPIDLAENHVYLSVMLNGKGPYRFIFDTGGVNIVDPAVAQEIGAAGHGSIQGGGVGSKTESLSFAKVRTLQVGDATVRDQLFALAPTRLGFGMSAGQRVDGLIGFEVLSRFVTTFDYANSRVVLQLPSSTAPRAGADVCISSWTGSSRNLPAPSTASLRNARSTRGRAIRFHS